MTFLSTSHFFLFSSPFTYECKSFKHSPSSVLSTEFFLNSLRDRQFVREMGVINAERGPNSLEKLKI